MLVTLILGAGAGVLAPHAEGFIKGLLSDALMAEAPISPAETSDSNVAGVGITHPKGNVKSARLDAIREK